VARCLNFLLPDERGNWAKLVTTLAESGVQIEAATLVTNDDNSVSVHIAAADKPGARGQADLRRTLETNNGQEAAKARTVQLEIPNSTESLAELSTQLSESGANVFQLVYSARPGERTGVVTMTLAPGSR
jgi:hypothetical protein